MTDYWGPPADNDANGNAGTSAQTQQQNVADISNGVASSTAGITKTPELPQQSTASAMDDDIDMIE